MSGDRIPKDHAEELADCFAAHARGLFGYACALTCGDHALADDLVQSAFVAAARQWSTMRCLRDAQRLRWLQTTVGHIAISGFRFLAPEPAVRTGALIGYAGSAPPASCWTASSTP